MFPEETLIEIASKAKYSCPTYSPAWLPVDFI